VSIVIVDRNLPGEYQYVVARLARRPGLSQGLPAHTNYETMATM
jgi:hypothetical protein